MSAVKLGRPRKFNDPKELVDIIEAYFNSTPVEEYTITGLSLLVGSKQLLNDYQDRDGFEDIITEAKLIIENAYELSLRKNGRAGDIFALKNFDWKDKQEVDSVNTNKNIDVANISKDKVAELNNILDELI